MQIHLHHDFWNVSDFDQIPKSKEEEERKVLLNHLCRVLNKQRLSNHTKALN